MKTKAATFLRLLPVLRHLAKFPSCNWGAMCAKHGASLDEVRAVITDLAGTLVLWDEEHLAHAAQALGVDLAAHPEQPARFAGNPHALKPKGEAAHKVRPLAAARRAAAEVAPDTGEQASEPPTVPAGAHRWLQIKKVRRDVIARYLPVLARLALGAKSIVQACAAEGINYKAFLQFREGYFGAEAITPEIHRAFCAWCRTKGIAIPAIAELTASEFSELGRLLANPDQARQVAERMNAATPAALPR
jgi:hypothetical protein